LSQGGCVLLSRYEGPPSLQILPVQKEPCPKLGYQFVSDPLQQCIFLIFCGIGTLKSIQNNASRLPGTMRLVEYNEGPGEIAEYCMYAIGPE